MSLISIPPAVARDLMNQGAVLIDIRAADEHAREHIAGARRICVEQLPDGMLPVASHHVIFHCRSGARTQHHAQALSACTTRDAYMLEGGLDAWKKAGLPVVVDASRPIALQRQVQIVAGILILLGALLGATVSPWFHVLSGAVGAGLLFAGLSGFCGMARLLMRMPWNR